jgi:hypothetical protein
MTTFRRLLTTSAALAGLVVAATSLSASSMNRLEYLTFSRAVALPGVTLNPGSYSFEIMNPDSGDVVLVRNRATNAPLFLGLTFRVERPAASAKNHVVLGEARRGEASPILAWYPNKDTVGREFIYRK